MEDHKNVPYFVHEGIVTRNERTIKRLICVIVLAILLIFASNAMWLWYMSGYDIETYEYAQDGVGVNIIGSRNGVDYVAKTGYQEDDQEEESEAEVGAPQS